MRLLSNVLVALALVMATPTCGTTRDAKNMDSSRFLDSFRDHVARCLYLPEGARREKVRVEIYLDRDGSLAQPPKAVGPQPLSDVAQVYIRALRRCAPYRFPVEFSAVYDDWKHLTIEFEGWRR